MNNKYNSICPFSKILRNIDGIAGLKGNLEGLEVEDAHAMVTLTSKW